MDLGLHIANFTWSGGSSTFVDDLRRTAKTAEDVGFTKISVMDHVWQIGMIGPPEHEMLEAYTALGYLAAITERVQLLAWVTAAVYREPGLLAKEVTTLDVLSKGRAMLGIGAAWNEEESVGLGLPFPGTAERFERLEETLQICLQMWGESVEPYAGEHYRLGSTLNSPQSVQRPHPPILIGGGGEKKTLRMVAQYAQACNLFDSPDLAHKLEVLRGRGEGQAETHALLLVPRGTDAEPGAPLREHVEGRDLLGEQPGLAVDGGRDPGEQLHLLGDGREEAEGRVGLEHLVLLGPDHADLPDVVHDRELGEADVLGRPRRADEVVDEGGGAAAPREVGEVQSEMHPPTLRPLAGSGTPERAFRGRPAPR